LTTKIGVEFVLCFFLFSPELIGLIRNKFVQLTCFSRANDANSTGFDLYMGRFIMKTNLLSNAPFIYSCAFVDRQHSTQTNSRFVG
jgi:hypothetical protein